MLTVTVSNLEEIEELEVTSRMTHAAQELSGKGSNNLQWKIIKHIYK
jgi:hypothetical protein